MANTYDVGDQIRLSATFTNSTGTTVDPTAVTVRIKDPSGVAATLAYLTDVALVRSTRGLYYTDVTIDLPGTWLSRWVGTGAAIVAAEHYWLVRQSTL